MTRIRIPLIMGNIISICMMAIALIVASHAYLFSKPIRILILIICWFMMLYFTHCLSHYIVGRLLGIRFRYYFLSKSMLSKANIPLISRLTSVKAFLTLKLAEKPKGWKGFAMFIAGPLASMLSPRQGARRIHALLFPAAIARAGITRRSPRFRLAAHVQDASALTSGRRY